ncbi:hypothetical protein [Dinghuibacter silviterrae]|uniref:Uncharacterized protein n=1 Tax=Dinghuibacter silviterrae TaxID=1539049 RepID=A0A4R8DT26_9BACT|nr:hypothetical protein [Dinghuibacter silviterrae]TDX01442.1 hypothetical protein EDB95_2477 [Dinghuibacter silviterrae]
MQSTSLKALSRVEMKSIKGGGPQLICPSQGETCTGSQGTGVCVPHGITEVCYCSIPGYPIEWPCPNPL